MLFCFDTVYVSMCVCEYVWCMSMCVVCGVCECGVCVFRRQLPESSSSGLKGPEVRNGVAVIKEMTINLLLWR